MQKLSAGILLFTVTPHKQIKVFLVHPGGPIWKNKDVAAWSIPKGEYLPNEDPLLAAKREFKEETGNDLPNGDYIPLQPIKTKSGKIVSAWCLQVNTLYEFIESNLFEMEWPPRSGKKQFFVEVDKAEWFLIEDAKIKINTSQIPFLEQLNRIVFPGNES